MVFKDFGIEEGRSQDIDTYLMEQMVIQCTASTRPTALDGRRIWQTDNKTGWVYIASEAAWVLLSGTRIIAIKPSNETVNNSATLQPDDHLSINVAANTTYIIDFNISLTADSTADFSMRIDVPTSSTFQWSTQSPHITQSFREQATFSNFALGVGSRADAGGMGTNGATNTWWLASKAILVTTNSGAVAVQWCQSTAHASNAVVYGSGHSFGGSWIMATAVA